MKQYLDLLTDILENGHDTGDRTGTGTRSVFGRQLRWDLSKGFPMMTTKKLPWKSVVLELLWILRGETNANWLNEREVKIWNEWADGTGELGPVYGRQWRKWETNVVAGIVTLSEPEYVGEFQKRTDIKIGEKLPEIRGKNEVLLHKIDQIRNVIDRIKTKPDCRRLIVSAWNVADIDKMKLPPCHCFFQFKVYGNKLSCQLYQRSCDVFLGVPFNIASYALLTHMVAKECGLEVGEFIHTYGDVHIYNNHREQVAQQLLREPFELPKLELTYHQSMLGFAEGCHVLSWPEMEGFFKLHGYQAHNSIKAEVSV